MKTPQKVCELFNRVSLPYNLRNDVKFTSEDKGTILYALHKK